MGYLVRNAKIEDWKFVKELLLDICYIHKKFRPDLFKEGGLKFSKDDFQKMLNSERSFVHVCESNDGEILAYLFTKINKIENSDMRTDRKILYIDDLCVREDMRGKGVGSCMIDFSKEFAVKMQCDSIELNAWAENTEAIKLYEKYGFKVQRSFYEYILK